MSPPRFAGLSALISQVLDEAKSPTGTWTLATHSQVDDALLQSPASDVEHFMSEVIKRIISPESEQGERFKLSQLCTMARQKQYLNVEQVFIRYKNDLQATARAVPNSPLGHAAARLIESLFQERPQRPPQPIQAKYGPNRKFPAKTNHAA
jgi:hypothetical protein